MGLLCKAFAGVFVFGALLGEEVLDGGDAEGAYLDAGPSLFVLFRVICGFTDSQGYRSARRPPKLSEGGAATSFTLI